MNLHYQVFPETLDESDLTGSVPLIILPGLFGSIANWRSVARKYAESSIVTLADSANRANVARPVIVVDQRNHGQSPQAPSHTYADMVSDLELLCESLGLTRIVLCGHSMGGKVAMLFALNNAAMLEKLVVLDIAPVRYTHTHAPYIEALMQLDLQTLKSRSDADRQVQQAIPDTATRLFLLQSLAGSAGNYHWRLNLPVLHQYMDDVIDFPLIEKTVDTQALFLAGANSNYVTEQHHSVIKRLFSEAQFATIQNAGHWLHAEQPALVIQALQDFIES